MDMDVATLADLLREAAEHHHHCLSWGRGAAMTLMQLSC